MFPLLLTLCWILLVLCTTCLVLARYRPGFRFIVLRTFACAVALFALIVPFVTPRHANVLPIGVVYIVAFVSVAVWYRESPDDTIWQRLITLAGGSEAHG